MNIYLIAGPPGIGKSTNSVELIPAQVPIIDQDLAAYQYKKQGFTDYQDIASLTSNQRIREFLFNNHDFALELNLGFESHYAYLRSIANFDPANVIHLLLFFTDNLSLCLNRARVRYQNGGHEVKPPVIEEMYHNTITLFHQHKSLFNHIILVDITYTSLTVLTPETDPLPDWVLQNKLDAYLFVQ